MMTGGGILALSKTSIQHKIINMKRQFPLPEEGIKAKIICKGLNVVLAAASLHILLADAGKCQKNKQKQNCSGSLCFQPFIVKS
jgi:hypothetical protein